MSEDNFGLRLKRYAEVGGAVGGLAAKLAGQRQAGQLSIVGDVLAK